MLKKRQSKKTAEPKPWGSVTSRLVLLFLLIMLVMLTYGLFSQLQRQEQARHDNLLLARILAQSVAGRLADSLAIYRGVLQRIGQNPALSQLLAAKDWQGLKQLERSMARQLPEVQRLRFLPVEWDQLEADPGAGQQFSYASLEVLRMVERSGKAAPAEVHQLGKDGQHVALAAPIIDSTSGELSGVAHMALAFRTIGGALADVQAHAGKLELQQVTEQGTGALLASGAATGATREDGAVAVAGSIWRVAYWRAGEQPDTSYLLLAGVALMVAVLVVGLLIMMFAMRLKSALASDHGAIVELARGLLQGGGVQHQPVARIRDLQPMLEQLVKLAQERPRKTRVVEAETTEQQATVQDAPPAPAEPVEQPPAAVETGTGERMPVPPAEIFRAYDIRGVAGEALTSNGVYQIGRALGSEALEQGQQTVIVARDGRLSSDQLSEALVRGLADSGRDVVDLGRVPTPVLYFATHFLGSNSGVMVTGSHNPPEYNGLKAVIDGQALSGDAIQGLRQRIIEENLLQGEGRLQEQDLVPDYISRVSNDVQLLRPLKLVLDCGNGVASLVAPALFRALGCETVDRCCEVDGNFPQHHPDPGNPDNLRLLISAVREHKADLGLAFDGDGDRLGVVDCDGKIIWPDRLLMLLARDVLLRNPGGDVIYDIKSSRHLASEILACGGRPIMWNSGHSLMKAKIQQTGALLAAEMSGHIYFQERWYGFDDALYAAARLLEVVSAEGLSTAELFAQFPDSPSTPELNLQTAEGENFVLVRQFAELGPFPDAKLITMDGVRAEFTEGWGLVRASNTAPMVTFRFEADSQQAIERIQDQFRDRFAAIDPALELPF